jgi:hypothetical protein
MLAISLIFKNLARVNKHLMDENSPNLVTQPPERDEEEKSALPANETCARICHATRCHVRKVLGGETLQSRRK